LTHTVCTSSASMVLRQCAP